MTGLEQLQDLSWALYVLIFVVVLVRAIRRPTPAHIDMALFFGAAALIVVGSAVPAVLGITPPVWLSDLNGTLLVSLAYLQLRLVADFGRVPRPLMRAAEAGLVLSVLAIVLVPPPMPPLIALIIIAYFVLLVGYCTVQFVRAALVNRGVTRRRMQAAAAGSICLALVLLLATGTLFAPNLSIVWQELSAIAGLGSAICYFVGFAPPTWLRRAW